MNRQHSQRVAAGPSLRRRYARRFGPLLALLAGLSIAGTGVTAASQPANALQLKAAFVLNFLQFVEWPGARGGPATIGVLGDDQLTAALTDAARRTTASVAVQRLIRHEDARGVHLLFIGAAEASRLPAVLRSVDGLPVLTVGDTLGFARSGVMLNLYTFDQRIRIEVNTAAAARARLRVSSHLLRLARIVE